MRYYRVFCILSFTFFVAYFAITLFFNLPNNYLKVNATKENAYFQFFLFQRWGFFAPPPTHNDRLFYLYKSEKDSVAIIVEVLENLYKQKSAKAPFNSKEDILDYLISNSLISLSEEIAEIKNYKRYALMTGKLQKDTSLINFIKDGIRETEQYKTLLNYGKLLANESLNLKKKDSIAFIVSRIFIPKFVDRYSDSLNNEMEIVFNSKFHELK